MPILFVESHLGAHDDAHVGERGSFGVGACRIAVELGSVGGRRILLGGKLAELAARRAMQQSKESKKAVEPVVSFISPERLYDNSLEMQCQYCVPS